MGNFSFLQSNDLHRSGGLIIDLVAVFSRPAHQLPVDEHVADDGVENPAVIHALELDLDKCRRWNVKTHGQLESVNTYSRRQVTETGCIEGWQFWWSAWLLFFLLVLLI